MNERLARVMKALNKSNAQMARLMGYAGPSGFNNLLHSNNDIPEAKLNMLVSAEIDGKKVSRSYLLGESDSIFVNDIQIMEAAQPGSAEPSIISNNAMNATELTKQLNEAKRTINQMSDTINALSHTILNLSSKGDCLGEVVSPNPRRE